jgi:HD-GYP domain-containing protein (c-di-GMP phosphodiesterase class II)
MIEIFELPMYMIDSYTLLHQNRVSSLSRCIVRKMNVEQSIEQDVVSASRLHDIGKQLIPASILEKKGKVTDEEMEIIRHHPYAGFCIAEQHGMSAAICDAILHHHERLDGTGYPSGLIGDQIMLLPRIIAVADVVDAISHDRPYKKGLGLNKALAEVKAAVGSHYDPIVFRACLAVFNS